jgi:hypothetical protein
MVALRDRAKLAVQPGTSRRWASVDETWSDVERTPFANGGALDDFKRKADESSRLDLGFLRGDNVLLLSPGDWLPCDARLDTGVMTMSPIGFSAGGTWAVVAIRRGWIADRVLLLLNKAEGRWSIAKERTLDHQRPDEPVSCQKG